MCFKKPKTPQSGASCIIKTTKVRQVGLLDFADLSLEQRFITTWQGVINLSQIYSLNSVIPSFRNRIYSGDKVIREIRHIYPWNRVIPPFRNRPQGYCATIMTSRRLFRHNPVSRGTNQPIRKSEFVQGTKVE